MNGIDISKHQGDIDLSNVPCEFVIVKATQGTSYINPFFASKMKQADAMGKFIGAYHYASQGGAIAEAEHFLRTVGDYVGKVILVLDWEGEQNPNFDNPRYALAFLKYVREKTGITPFIYMSKSVCRQYAKIWDPEFPLWCAQYKNQNPTGYQDAPWTDKKSFGAWDSCKILQYSSKGNLAGYAGNLDLDKSYMDALEWRMWATGCPVTQHKADDRPIVRKGDCNEYVRAWQTFLSINGYNCGPIDGIFGDKTEAAVIKWQADHPVCGKADGIIGPKTWGSI